MGYLMLEIVEIQNLIYCTFVLYGRYSSNIFCFQIVNFNLGIYLSVILLLYTCTTM